MRIDDHCLRLFAHLFTVARADMHDNGNLQHNSLAAPPIWWLGIRHLVRPGLKSLYRTRVARTYDARMGSAVSLLAKFSFQFRLYAWPFGIDDTEIDGVPDAAACGDHVIPESALLARADPQNRSTGAIIQRIGL